MLTFSSKPEVAESQMQAVIFIMTTFGYIDGDFDQREKAVVRDRIRTLGEGRVDGAQRPSGGVRVRRLVMGGLAGTRR